MKLIIKIILTLTSLFFIGFVGLCWFFSSLIVRPMNASSESDKNFNPEKWGVSLAENNINIPTPETFSVVSEDEITIKGWYFDHPDTANCAVVYAHGWGSSRSGMLKFADLFWECGCDLVFYDHRVHNESGGIVATAGIKEKVDLIKVTQWLQEKTGFADKQIAWFGESWGGATVLQAGALDKDVAFIVADSPFQDWNTAISERANRLYGNWITNITDWVMWTVDWRTGLDHNLASPMRAAKNIKEPVFLIHSQGDTKTASSQSVNIAKRLNPETSEFHHTNWGADHVMDIKTRPEEYRALLHAFVKEKVGNFGKCE